MKIHQIFYIPLLERMAEDLIEEQIISPPPPVKVEGEEQYKVDENLSSRINQRGYEYLVKWTEYK